MNKGLIGLKNNDRVAFRPKTYSFLTYDKDENRKKKRYIKVSHKMNT